MLPEDVQGFLLSQDAEPLLALARDFAGGPLELVESLRRQVAAPIASAVAEQAALQVRGRTKFALADRMRFTRDALEASTGEVLARHRAQRFSAYPRVMDLTCGIGGDLLSLAQAADTVGIDRDLTRLRYARHNLSVHGRDAGLLCADVSRWVPPSPAYLLDPSRRERGRRVTQLTGLEPDISLVDDLLGRRAALAVKLSPALDWGRLPWQAEAELVSYAGECREAVLWFGELSTARVRATVLPEGASLTGDPEARAPVRPPEGYLLEPDPAVVRAHMVGVLAARLGAGALDPEIAYLVADRPHETPFATAYRILEARPFGLKDLRSRLRELGRGPVVVKKRGVAYDPDEIRRRLKPQAEGPEVTVVLTRLGSKPWAILCERLSGARPGPTNQPTSAPNSRLEDTVSTK
ncbi:MAG TPA: class I SAM-dependent methyltransferase [Armatimonadota bacterium]|jgi:hypothetical protein